MNFYKINALGCEESIVFRCEENYNSNSMALDYAVKNNILPESFEVRTLTVSQADESGYTNHLLGEMLDNPEEMVKIICSRVENGDFSCYNERICSYIASGLEE